MSMFVESSRDNLASRDETSFPWGSSLSDSWYSRRSKLEKSLLFSTIGLSALCVGLIIGLAIAASNNSNGATYPTLEGNSSKLSTPSPCDDFLEYACRQEPDDPDRKVSEDFHDTMLPLLRDALSKDQRDEDPLDVRSAKAFFRTCMRNESAIDGLAYDLRKMGGWPIAEGDNWNSSDFQFETLYVALHKVIKSGIIISQVLQDNGNIVITVPGKMYGTNATIRSILEKVNSLGGKTGVQTRTDAEGILVFHDDLARHVGLIKHHEQNEVVDQGENRMTVSELQERAGQFFHWDSLLEGTLGIPIPPSTLVTVTDLSYLTAVDNLLFSSKPRHIANYLLWCYVEAIAWHAGGAVTAAVLPIEKWQSGISDREERWMSCTVLTDNVMFYATARLFLQDYIFPIFSKAQVFEFVEAIQRSIRDVVPAFHRKDRDLAIDTANLIGFPDWMMTEFVFDKVHGDVEIDQNLYYSMLSAFETPNNQSERSEQRNPQQISIWNNLESFFYITDKDSAQRFGGIGTRVASNIINQFLQEGIEKYECFVKRHDELCRQSESVKTQCINGEITVQDDIADSAAISAAYKAYYYWLSRNGTEEPNYEDDKLFFLEYARNWCGDLSSLDSRKHRVNGALWDFEAFAEAFRCQGENTERKLKCGFL